MANIVCTEKSERGPMKARILIAGEQKKGIWKKKKSLPGRSFLHIGHRCA